MNGEPHIVPICFAYDGKVFYSAIDRKPKRVPAEQMARVRHIRRDSQVALLIDQYREDWRRLWYVLVRGQATLLSKPGNRERTRAVRLLKMKYAQYAAGMLSDDAPVIRITPRKITSWGKGRSAVG
jgi:coenzyme F420-0:L-glutamate ligase / coenzyme F420-1:gamma-L-glutamate ligase